MNKQFAKLKVYELGGGVAFSEETATIPFLVLPKGQATMKPWGPSGFVFENVITGDVIAFVDTFDDVLDSAGVVYGVSQIAVMTAVSAFFFELGGGGGIEYPISVGNENWQNFQDNLYATTTNVFNTGIQGPVVEIRSKVTTNKVRIRVQTANAGQTAVAGIYKYNGTTWDLQAQAVGTFDLGVNAVQELSYAANLVLDVGIYVTVIHMSANTTVEAITVNAQKNIFGYANTMGATSYRNYFNFTAAYTGVLPANIASNPVAASSLAPQILHNII